jgi:hypothetical protein
MQQLLIRRSTRRVFLLLAAALLLGSSSALLTSAAEDAPPLVLEPGEVVTDRADRSSLIPLEEGPSTKKAATCDSAESRRARAIIREVSESARNECSR